MKAREFCFSLITIVTLFCSFDSSKAEEEVNIDSMRIGDSTLEVSSLELMLDPLTSEELELIAKTEEANQERKKALYLKQ